MRYLDSLTLSQFERRISPLRRNIENTLIRMGWIRYVRTTLRLSLRTLARLLGVSLATIAQIEKRELEGKVTLETLRKVARAMDCEFVYAFVPKKEIQTLIKDRAYEKARKILLKANTHMILENQKVERPLEERVKMLAEKFIKEGDVW